MYYNRIGKIDLKVSRMALGAMSFGKAVNEADGIAITHYMLDHGVNLIDTADRYNDGRSELIVGKALAGRREKVILATKCGYPNGTSTVADLSKSHILAAAEASLKRLNTDFIDLYYLHAPDHNTPVEETLEAMDQLVRDGKVRYFGVSNFAAWSIMELLWKADKNGLAVPCVTESLYNAISRNIESELVPCVRAENLGLIVYNPLAAGLLSGKHKAGSPAVGTRFGDSKMYRDRYWNDDSFYAVEKLTKLAEENGMALLELAIRWCLSQPVVTSVLLGMSHIEQVKQNLLYAEADPLPASVLQQCDEIWNEISDTRAGYSR